MEFKIIEGGKQMNNSNQKEENQNNRAKDGLKILAVAGLGAGLYGFKLGRRYGYNVGFKDGYKEASDEFITVMKELTAEFKAARGD